MVVIDPTGRVVYNGAIDDKPTTRVEDLAGARNYVQQALTDARAGRPVTPATTEPYGCSVTIPRLRAGDRIAASLLGFLPAAREFGQVMSSRGLNRRDEMTHSADQAD